MAPVQEQPETVPYILSFEAEVAKTEPESIVLRLSKAAWRKATWLVPCSARTPIGRDLRLHLIYALLQMAGMFAIVVNDSSRIKLLLFNVFLSLESILLYGTIRDIETLRLVNEIRRHQTDVKAKLWGLVSAAFLAPLWWFFDIISAIHSTTNSYYGSPRPLDEFRVILAAIMAVHHLFIFAHLVYITRRTSRRLVQCTLPAKKLTAVKFEQLSSEVQEKESACSICLSDYQAEEHVIRLPCGHIYHAECICMWVSKGDSCPMRCDGALLEPPPGAEDMKIGGRWNGQMSERLSNLGRNSEVQGEDTAGEAALPQDSGEVDLEAGGPDEQGSRAPSASGIVSASMRCCGASPRAEVIGASAAEPGTSEVVVSV